MLNDAAGAGLDEEAPCDLYIGGKLRVQNLDRHTLMKLFVDSLEDLTHPSFADYAHQAIRPDFRIEE